MVLQLYNPDGDDVPGYTVVVRATDPDGMPGATETAVETNSDVITVTITVTQVNEAPVVMRRCRSSVLRRERQI